MAQAKVGAGGMTRREFLYYIWGASMALFTAEFTGLLIWFAIPRFREGEFGGAFKIPVDELSGINELPVDRPDGRFWLVNLDTREPNDRMFRTDDETDDIIGVAAIYKVCTHLGCIYAWNAPNQRFECPCHGSKYRLDGRRIESPAPRTLDRFSIAFLDAEDTVLAESSIGQIEGSDAFLPLDINDHPNTAFIRIDTGNRLDGPTQHLICDFRGNCP